MHSEIISLQWVAFSSPWVLHFWCPHSPWGTISTMSSTFFSSLLLCWCSSLTSAPTQPGFGLTFRGGSCLLQNTPDWFHSAQESFHPLMKCFFFKFWIKASCSLTPHHLKRLSCSLYCDRHLVHLLFLVSVFMYTLSSVALSQPFLLLAFSPVNFFCSDTLIL